MQQRREGFVFTKAAARMRNKQTNKDNYDEGCTEEEEKKKKSVTCLVWEMAFMVPGRRGGGGGGGGWL